MAKSARKAGRKPPAKAKRKPNTKGKAKAKPAKAPKARARAGAKRPRTGRVDVTAIAGASDPVSALTRYAESLGDRISTGAAQTLLASATLTLAGLAGERGSDSVNSVVDTILGRWSRLPDPGGFHAQQVLGNAAATVLDRERLAAIESRVSAQASSQLLFNLACGWAVVGDRARMVSALERALAAGVSPTKIRRDADFANVLGEPEVERALSTRKPPAISADIAPHLARIKTAVDRALAAVRKAGAKVELGPPASLEAVLAAEAAGGVHLPNDFRALLTLHDGMVLGDEQFFGTHDVRGGTPLHTDAKRYIEMSSRYGGEGIDDCVPLANWGSPNNWLLYDPVGLARETGPGYVVMLNADPWPHKDLREALDRIAKNAADQ